MKGWSRGGNSCLLLLFHYYRNCWLFYQVSDTLLLCLFLVFLQKLGNEEQQEKLLREWLDCCVTEGGVLVAMQKSSRRRNHPLVTQMVEKWLDRYRQIRPCTSLSDGEEDEDDEDEWNKHLRRKKDQGIRSEMAPKLVWYLKSRICSMERAIPCWICSQVIFLFHTH